MVALGVRRIRVWGFMIKGFSWHNENVLKLIVGMEYHSEYNKAIVLCALNG